MASTFSQNIDQKYCYNEFCSDCGSGDDGGIQLCDCDGDNCLSETLPTQRNPDDCSTRTGVCQAGAQNETGAHDTAACPPGKWACSKYDRYHSTKDAVVCTDPDPGQCALICDNNQNCISSPTAEFTENTLDICTFNNSAEIVCTYDASKFDAIGYVDSWNQAFSSSKYQDEATDNLNKNIYPNVCGKTASSVGVDDDGNDYSIYCPEDPETGQLMTDCSRFVLKDDPLGYGDACRNWCDNNSDICSSTISNYCIDKNTPDCACVSRSNDDTYKKLINAGLQGTNASCWWLPCTGDLYSPYLKTADLQPCEVTDICQSVTNVLNGLGGTVNIGDTSSVINCGNGQDDPNDTDDPGGEDDGINSIIIIIIAIGIIVSAIVFFVFILYPLFKKSGSKE